MILYSFGSIYKDHSKNIFILCKPGFIHITRIIDEEMKADDLLFSCRYFSFMQPFRVYKFPSALDRFISADTLTEQGKLSAYNRTTILEMANKVVNSLMSNYEKALKGVESVMGGTVLEYKAKNIYREGKIETLVTSIKALIETGQYNFDSAFNLIKAPTDEYNVIKELVLG